MTDIITSAKSVVSTVTGFLGHHVTDLNNIADVLSQLVAVVPLNSAAKTTIHDAIATVKNSADNITNFLETTDVQGASASDVVVKESDLVTAVANFFASPAGQEALANAAKGNSNG